jgi:hypothetical protein
VIGERILATNCAIHAGERNKRSVVCGAGVNPAPTLGVNESPVGAGLTPACVDYHSLQLAQLRLDCFAGYWLDSLSRLLI